MSRLPTPGSDDGNWGEILNDFLEQSHNSDGSLKSSAIPTIAASDVTTSDSSTVQSKLTDHASQLAEIALNVNDATYKKLYVTHRIDLTASGWTTSHASKQQVGNSLQLTHSGDGSRTGYIQKDFGTQLLDASRCHMLVDFSLPAGSGLTAYTTVDKIVVQLLDDSSVIASYTIMTNGNYILHPGNYGLVDFLPSAPDVSSACNLARIRYVRINVNAVNLSSDTPVVVINAITLHTKPREKGKVIFGFDGVYADQVAAANYLTTLGLKATLFVGGAYVDSGDGIDRMNLTQLNGLHADGHFVANYAATTGYWYDKTISQKIADVTANAQWLYAHGFGDGAKYISTPGGGYAADESALYDGGHVIMITGRAHTSNLPRPSGYIQPMCPYAVGPGVANTNRTAAVDAAVSDNAVCLFIFHQCAGKSGDITYANFCAIADYVKTKVDAGLIDVVTPDMLSKYTLSYPPA